ncbi:Vacuolar transporter chaperone 4 [Neolecta irregularis DAH-3]|uniref:Vacuolar transporter chaperone 4 n=1 Tax=Neolecta irregularis (strain DAH-3) TaxID=1198029 RepID=A0A1U7LNQ6_NEOID|nr:Vacuolar transporter chaperone 4 [Neolecta irregularis DAH-3]|eukprot:OLL24284.1 Vacuolar transporter chaperone 4 [Neolecta irregularis DAH-3]
MKFGSVLSLRSAAQWKHYNLQYNDIKNVIKEATTRGCSTPDEEHLARLLQDEAASIDNFVKTKALELEGRIQDCQKSVEDLYRLSAAKSPQHLKQFIKVNEEIDGITRDVQSLARFVGVQRTGFKKLLKKHQKWCTNHCRPSLSEKFQPILERKHPFHKRLDFNAVLLDISALYDAVRHKGPRKQHPSKARVADLTAFEPPEFNKVTFWIHTDNFVEAELLILRHLPLKDAQQACDLLYLDSPDLEAYSGLINAEDTKGKLGVIQSLECAEVSISTPDIHDESRINLLPIKYEWVEEFLEGRLDANTIHSYANDIVSSKDMEGWIQAAHAVVAWITTTKARPVIKMQSSQTLFAQERGFDVITASLSQDVKLSYINNDKEEKETAFPHVILEIEWQNEAPRLVHELDCSHLVERVSGFSPYVHGVATLCPSTRLLLPTWVSLLQKDIRKTPPQKHQTHLLRRPAVVHFKKPSSSTGASTGDATGDEHHQTSSNTSASHSRVATTCEVKYWNELDQDERDRKRAFTVQINEHTRLLAPSRHTAEDLLSSDNENKDTGFGRRITRRMRIQVKKSAISLKNLFNKQELDDSDEDQEAFFSEYGTVPMYTSTFRGNLLFRGYLLCMFVVASVIIGTMMAGLYIEAENVAFTIASLGACLAMAFSAFVTVNFLLRASDAGLIAGVGFGVSCLLGVGSVLVVWISD